MISIEQRKKNWLDFYSGEKRTLVLIEMHTDNGPAVYPTGDNKEQIFKRVVQRSKKQIENLEWLDDDRIPCVSALTGTEIYAQAFGSPVIYPGNNTSYARPAVFSAAEAAKIKKPELEKSTLMELIENAQRLQKAVPGVLLQLVDMQSPLDIAALVWEKADFFISMYDDPEAVKDFIGMIAALQTEFMDLWFKTFGKEFVAHYPDYYMPYGITFSEDEIGSISNEQFNEFSIPHLSKMSEHFGGRIGIHCCANAKHQWPLLKSIPGLVMINLVQPDDIIKEASTYFRDGPCEIFLQHQNALTDTKAKVVLQRYASSKEEALAVLAELREMGERYR